MHYIKRLEGFPIKLQMVTAVWEEVALDDLLVLSEASDNCLKLTFDPVIDTMTTRLHFGGGIRKGRVLRTMTRPTLMGIIQAREVDSVLREPEIMADGWVVGGGLGLQSPLLVDKIQESEYLKALAAVPPSKGKVRAIDHTSGYLFQPLDDAARSASSAKGTWKVHYILLSEAGGGVPLWAAEKGAPAHWWDECRTIRVAGFRDARHCQKKLEGFPLKLQMVSAVWEDVSLEELIMVTEVIDDCAKLQFVPVMEKVQTRLVFGGGLRLLQTSIRPALLGLVSSREVDSLMKEPEMRESGWVVSTGVGLQSPLLVEKIENGGSSVLKTLVSAPPSKGKVRAIDHTSGYAFRAGDQPRSWHLVPEDIFKGRVNRMSKDTSRHFLEGAALRPCRDALSRAGYEVEIQGGCLVFVHPHQYEDVLRALQTFTLTRADIVFAASFEYLVEQTLSLAVDVGCQGSWMKSRDQLPMEIETDGEQKEESVEVDGVLEIDRTFYRWRPATAAASNPKPLTF
eukprot:g23389.t1